MSRSAIDATRFTATSLHAFSKLSPLASLPYSSATPPPSSIPSAPSQPLQRPTNPSYPPRIPRQNNPKNPSPAPTETPAQKVARLRAQRAALRDAEITRWDRIVFRGRIIADAAHKITVTGLIIFSGVSSFPIPQIHFKFNWVPTGPAIDLLCSFYSLVSLTSLYFPPPSSLNDLTNLLTLLAVLCAGVTIFALSDMIIYNRRKRKEWYAQKTLERQTNLLTAIENEKAGLPLSEEQTIVMNQERARFKDEEERARKWRERWESLSLRRWLVSGLKSDEEQINQVAVEGNVQPTQTEPTEFHPQEPSEPEPTSQEGVLAAVENARRTEEKKLEAEGEGGGALDRMAARAAELGKGKGWWGWGSGKE